MELQHENGIVERLRDALTGLADVESGLIRITEAACRLTDADGAYVERIERGEKDYVRVAAAIGWAVPEPGRTIPFPGSLTEEILERGEPELIEDLGREKRAIGVFQVPCERCSAIVAPLKAEGMAIGALVLLRRHDRPAFDPQSVRTAGIFSELGSLALRSRILVEEAEARARELERVEKERFALLLSERRAREEAERRRQEFQQLMEGRARLLRGLSHDVKNPLGAADGYLQLLEEGISGDPLSPKQAEWVTRGRGAIKAALDLISDLLEFSRAQAGRLEIDASRVELGRIVRDAATDFCAAAENAGLQLRNEVPEHLHAVRTDEARVRQILGNLLSNAVKYTPSGGAIVVRAQEPAGASMLAKGVAMVGISVVDTGPGIPPEKQELIFEEFARLQPGAIRGSGVGLAMSRSIARLLGGELTVTSVPGSGSEFTLWLPVPAPVPQAEVA